MARPKNKEELLALSTANFNKLHTFIDALPAEEQQWEFPVGTMNRNIRDLLAHLHHWHLMMLDWYTVGMRGEKPHMPAKGYTWKDAPALNRKIWEKYTDADLDTVKGLCQSSYADLQAVINKHSNEELFTKKRYPWTGSTSLGSYLVSATSSHYDWALKFIKKARKKR